MLTLRDIPRDVNEALEKKAIQQHRTVDEVAVEAIKAGLGLNQASAGVQGNGRLASSIRARFAPLGGVELLDTGRQPIRDPDFGS